MRGGVVKFHVHFLTISVIVNSTFLVYILIGQLTGTKKLSERYMSTIIKLCQVAGVWHTVMLTKCSVELCYNEVSLSRDSFPFYVTITVATIMFVILLEDFVL